MNKKLSVGQYTPTEEFKAIPNMACVCYEEDRGLVAVTGPADDQESQEYAELFRAAPRMYKALKKIADRGCKCLGAPIDAHFCPAYTAIDAIKELEQESVKINAKFSADKYQQHLCSIHPHQVGAICSICYPDDCSNPACVVGCSECSELK